MPPGTNEARSETSGLLHFQGESVRTDTYRQGIDPCEWDWVAISTVALVAVTGVYVVQTGRLVKLAEKQSETARLAVSLQIRPLLVEVPRADLARETEEVDYRPAREPGPLGVTEVQAFVERDRICVSFPLRNVGSGVAAIAAQSLLAAPGDALEDARRQKDYDLPSPRERIGFNIPVSERGRFVIVLPRDVAPEVAEAIEKRAPFWAAVSYTDAEGQQFTRTVVGLAMAQPNRYWTARAIQHATPS